MSWFSRRKRRTAEIEEAAPAGPVIPDHPGPYDVSELPDLGGAFNHDTAWRHELARLA